MKRLTALAGRLLVVALLALLVVSFGCSDKNGTIFDTLNHIGWDTLGDGSNWLDSAYVLRVAVVEDAPQGDICSLSVVITPTLAEGMQMSSFRLLLQFDAARLSLQTVQPGAMLSDCGWEQFSYSQGASTYCGEDLCPTNVVRIMGVADLLGGTSPTCMVDDFDNEVELARLYFVVTNDRTVECTFAPVNFIWYECADNILSAAGDTALFSRYLWECRDSVRTPATSAHDWVDSFPTNWGAPTECVDIPQNDRVNLEPVRWLDLVAGGVDIQCADSVDIRLGEVVESTPKSEAR